MTHLLTASVPILLLDTAQPASLPAMQLAGLLDLMGLAAAIWMLWSSTWLPLGRPLQRAFRLISFGALAFAAAHLIDSLVQDLGVLSYVQATVLHQGVVMVSMLFFVPGLASLADALPRFSSKRHKPFPRIWPLAVGLAILIGALSFIVYGLNPEAEVAAFIGLDGSLILIAILCIILLLWTQIGSDIGRSLWLAALGLLIFSLAQPFQAWLYEQSGVSPDELSILHRLIVIPAFILFAISITQLARSMSRMLIAQASGALAQQVQSARVAAHEEEYERLAEIDSISPRARARQNIEQTLSGPIDPYSLDLPPLPRRW